MRWERVRQVGLGDSSSGPGKRWGHTCNAIKGGRFLYVFGGFGRDHCLTNQVHVFDAETQIWTQPVVNGVPPCPRDSHSCTTVGDNLFVFGGTDGTNYLKDLHILDTSSHTWMCADIRGEGPGAREAHSAVLVDKRLFIFGGCGKSSDSDDEVFYNDLYILNTETYVWKRAVTTGKPPSARDSHTCSTWKNKIIVVGGEDLDDYYLSDVHILDTDKFVWKELKTSGQLLTPRAGHVTVALERNLFVFGGFTDSQNLYNDLYVLDLETNVWSKVVAVEEGPSARFSSAAVCLDPYKAGLFFFLGGCNKNLEPLDDIYYLHTEGGCDVLFDQNPGSLSLRKQMKLKCQGQNSAVARTNIDQGGENVPLNIGSIGERKTMFQARVTENVPLGYTIETIIDGKVLRGVLFSNKHSSVQMADPNFSNSRKRPATSDGDSDHRAKIARTLSKDSAGSSQQADPIDPSDDGNKKVADSKDIDTSMIDTVDTNVNMVGPQEAETDAVKDQDASQPDTGIVNTEPLPPVTHDQANVEPLRNEISTDAAKADPGGDSSPQKQEEETVAANVEPLRNEISNAAKADPGGDSSPQKQEEETVAANVEPLRNEISTDAAKADPGGDSSPQKQEEETVAANVEPLRNEISTDAAKADPGGDSSPQKQEEETVAANVEPLRNEISTDAAKADPGGDSSPQKQEEETVAAEDENPEQQPEQQQH